MKFSTSISLPTRDALFAVAQVQYKHRLNLFASHPSVFLSTFTTSSKRLPHSEKELEEIGTQILYREFIRRKEILKVKKEEGLGKASKPPLKKRECL